MTKYNDYEINPFVFVLYETIEALESAYYEAIPEEVQKSLIEFKEILSKHLDGDAYSDDELEYGEQKYFTRIYFEKKQ